MPPLTYISAFWRSDANGGSRGEAMPEREINYVNAEQKVAQILGHFKDLITLSQALTNSTSFIYASACANIRLSVHSCKGSLYVFIPLGRYGYESVRRRVQQGRLGGG